MPAAVQVPQKFRAECSFVELNRSVLVTLSQHRRNLGEKRVGSRDSLRVPGGHKHWSGGDKAEGALFYEEASGKFDSIPAK